MIIAALSNWIESASHPTSTLTARLVVAPRTKELRTSFSLPPYVEKRKDGTAYKQVGAVKGKRELKMTN
jgi:hypothetical protein